MRTSFVTRVVRGSARLWVAALICLNATGCFRTLDKSKIQCVDDSSCPKPSHCSKAPGDSHGKCVAGSAGTGGSSYDGSPSTGSGGSGGSGGMMGDGPLGGGGSTSVLDAKPIDSVGVSDVPMESGGPDPTSCSSAAACSTGYCVDGVCCDTACDGQCESCKEAGSVGKCKAIKGSPLSPRAVCGGTGTCKGQCDGTNGKTCTFPDSTAICTAATCTTGKVTTASVCNSVGACSTPTSSTCPNSQCAADGSAKCATSCTASSCGAGFYCDTTGACLPTLVNGTSCSSGATCTSGYCVDGVCCDGKCDGQCESCKEAASTGKCTAVKGAPLATHTACGGTGTCKGLCDGTNGKACAFPDSTGVCTAATCTGGKATTASVCNGSGACTTVASSQCASNLCATDGSGKCSGSCTATSCSAGTYCDSTGTCTKTLDNGGNCSVGTQCTSGNCVDGVCCDGACTGQCQSCKASGSVGKCTAVKGAPVSPRAACGGTGKCTAQCDGTNGTTCAYPDSTTVCTAASCSAGKLTTQSVCNGSGNCTAATTNTCPSNLCGSDNASCSSSCTATSCGAGLYCGAGGACTPTLADGQPCSGNTQCTNGACADGVCCNTTCQEECKACNLGASKGTCTRLSSGQPVHASACATDGSTCGGSCNGSKDTCYFPASGQSCGTTSCNSPMTILSASVCNGSGSCGSAPQNCDSLGKYCDSTTTSCATKKSSGSCTLPIQCSSNCCSGNSCVSLGTNTNCSTCGDNCTTSGKTCQGGTCACGSGTTTCGSSCCSSSQTCYNGSCCTPSSQCGTLQCGQASNSCGGLVNCGSNGGGCPSGQTCNAGACQNTCQGGLYICNSCLAWNFESVTTQGWTATIGGVAAPISVGSGTGRGSYSLKVNVNDPYGSDITVTVPLCGNGASIVFPSAGYAFSAEIEFVGTYAFGDDGSGTGSVTVMISSEVGYFTPYQGAPPLSANQWLPRITGNLSPRTTFDASNLQMRFFPGTGWSGIIYIDNVSLN